jgi:hypothetical protein
MSPNRIATALRTETPPIVPQSVRGWLIPLGKLMLGAVILLGCTLAFFVGRQAQLLSDAAGRNH